MNGERVGRDQVELVVAMVDVDMFKKYNDLYGHAAGDGVLRNVAQTLRAQLNRPRDFVARYGGEEFVILSVGGSMEGVSNILQHCVDAVYDLGILHGDSHHQRVTISVGGISCIPSVDNTQSDILHQADQMLYHAKEAGRNRLQWRKVSELPMCVESSQEFRRESTQHVVSRNYRKAKDSP